MTAQFCLQEFKVGADTAGDADDGDLLSLETEVGVQEFSELKLDDTGCGDKDDREGELGHDQDLASALFFGSETETTFQNREGGKGGQEKGRIDPGKKAGQDGGCQHVFQQVGIVEHRVGNMGREAPCAQGANVRGQQGMEEFIEKDRSRQGQQGQQEGFAQKLCDQLRPSGPDHLAHTDLLGAVK